MSSYELLKKLFCRNNINQVYERIRPKVVAGLDKIDKYKFDSIKENEFNIIQRKVLNDTYCFTRYKKLLISKGENKKPRVVNIPTIRDKIVFSILNDMLNIVYDNANCSQLPHIIINDIKSTIDSNKYDYFIKYDIETFYASINHNILIKKIKYTIRNKHIIHLIYHAITNDGIVFPIKEKTLKRKRTMGVPEGLSISNSLANIYLISLDKKMKSISDIRYFRYVDDIIILCNEDNKEKVNFILQKEICQKLKLKINKAKIKKGLIRKSTFDYLGYSFNSNFISVRERSRLKLENSIELLFSQYKLSEEKNLDLFLWKINLKITGCIYQNKKYGWMFFYSQIDDKKLLSQLDWFVLKLIKRYNMNIKTKKFKKTYYEIRNNIHNTKYIVRFDKFTFNDKKRLLEKIYKRSIKNLDNVEINDLFEKLIIQDISLLEEDIQHFS